MPPRAGRLGPSILQRATLSTIVALASGAYVSYFRYTHPGFLSDLLQLVVAAKALFAGHDPYEAVRNTAQLPYPLIYPLPAILAVMPLMRLPMWAADGVFVALGAGVMVWALTCRGLVQPPMLALVSAPFLHSMMLSQWSPLMVGAGLMPSLGFLAACKPNLGLALFAAYPSRRAALGMTSLLGLSLLAWPSWPWEWVTAVATAPTSYTFLSFPGGALVLLPLCRWREPDARLISALGLIPQTTLHYAALPLLLIPKTWPEAWIMWTGTAVALTGHAWGGPYDSQLSWVRASGIWILYCGFLPAAVIVLMRDRLWRGTTTLPSQPHAVDRHATGSESPPNSLCRMKKAALAHDAHVTGHKVSASRSVFDSVARVCSAVSVDRTRIIPRPMLDRWWRG